MLISMKVFRGYHYSVLLALVATVFGFVLLGAGLDVLYWHRFLPTNPEMAPPAFVGYIALLLGVLASTGYLKAIISPWTLIELNEKGVQINLENGSIILVWEDLLQVSPLQIDGRLGGNARPRRVTALALYVQAGKYQIPATSRHRVFMKQGEDGREVIIIDGALNASKENIVRDILHVKKSLGK